MKIRTTTVTTRPALHHFPPVPPVSKTRQASPIDVAAGLHLAAVAHRWQPFTAAMVNVLWLGKSVK